MIETQTTNPVKTTKPRRWFRFRLRTLLIMVTVLSVTLGWVGWELDQRRREKSAIAWVEEMGGVVYFFEPIDPSDERSWWEKTKDNWLGERVRQVGLGHRSVSDLSPLAELNKLANLDFSFTAASDISPLAELKNLKTLGLAGTQVSDLSPLSELSNLEWLDLKFTPVNDLSQLAELKNLELLDLSNTPVSDLSPLAELKKLDYLGLNATQVNDLSPMVELKNLKELYLQSTQVSEEQVQELRLALPHCKIQLFFE